jgi:MATE family multidrug resistance protein
MSDAMTYRTHAIRVTVLGLPLVGGHLAQFAVSLTDTVMLGWYGVAELAAITLASSYFFVFFIFGSGFAWAVLPLVATAAGAGDETAARRATRMGLWLSTGFAALAMPAMIFAEPILLALGQGEGTAALAGAYLRIAGWGLFPALLVIALKSYLAALERTRAVFAIAVAAAVANGFANYALIFGNWGAPEMGLEGAAYASVVSHGVALLAIVVYAARALPEHTLFRRLWRPDTAMLRRLVALGVPIGVTSLTEVSLFAFSSVMMGWLGQVQLAAHGIVLTVASGTFMLHMGLSNVATIRVGQALGRRDALHLVRGARVVLAMSVCASMLTIAAFLMVPELLLSAFIDADADPAVRAQILSLGVTLFVLAALFQLVDGAQVVALGLLRGLQDTAVPMVIAGLSYWGVGLTSAYVAGFVLGQGAAGIWLGLVVGLACSGLFLTLRFVRICPRSDTDAAAMA